MTNLIPSAILESTILNCWYVLLSREVMAESEEVVVSGVSWEENNKQLYHRHPSARAWIQ